MGNSISNKYINFEDMHMAINMHSTINMHSAINMHTAINNNKDYIIINTLSENLQTCLIKGTLEMKHEEEILNTYLKTNKQINIIVYGMNSQDSTSNKKYEQLLALGFNNVFIYNGGSFEWLLLQDIYGKDLFPTTATERDILKYKGIQQFTKRLL